MIDNKKNLKEQLTTGMAVITENGTVYKVVEYPEQTYLVRKGGYLCLSQYDDDLKMRDGISQCFNIQTIYSTSSPACFVGDGIDGSLIWERPSRTDIKLEAIERKLGYKINIIKNKEDAGKENIKSIVKTGMTVKLNNGMLYRVIENYRMPNLKVEDFIFVRCGGFMSASTYNSMLIMHDRDFNEFDVQQIYDICGGGAFIGMDTVGELIWERKRYMTVEEIENRLGYKINII